MCVRYFLKEGVLQHHVPLLNYWIGLRTQKAVPSCSHKHAWKKSFADWWVVDAVQLISVADFLLVWGIRENQGECGYFFLRKVFIPTHGKKYVFLQLRQRGAQHSAEKEIPVHLNRFTGTEWCLHPANLREGMCLQKIYTFVKGSLQFFKEATKMSNPSFSFHHSCWSINSC